MNVDKPLRELLVLAHRLLAQTRTSKKKLYSVHAPEVECIAKGKAHKRYEFGCKSSIATTSKSNWIVGAHALDSNPYDGHTLEGAIRQTEPTIGHLKSDNRLSRNHRTGKTGNQINTLLAAAGYNLRKLLRWIFFRSFWA
ncbi:MAG: hypothetical protein GXP26_12200 [Planctomycetes bacterium]|nr:hypothetical protein [Planctomycetota bacterium]